MRASAPLVERVWRWLKYGSFGASARGYASYVGEVQLRWWQRPVTAWRTLTHRRPVVATPLLYVAAVATGAVIGLCLQWAAGIPWWIAPLVALAVAWLWVATSIWWHPSGRGTRLRTELLLAFAPARGVEAQRRENRERILASGLPFFAPEGSPQQPQGMSWGGSRGHIEHVVLNYSAAATPSTDTDPDIAIGALAREGLSEASLRTRIEAENELDARRGTWHAASLRVDGREHAGSEFVGTSIRAAYCAIGGAWVTVVSPRSAALTLKTVDDPRTVLELF